MAEKAELVDQVKTIQRADPDSKQAWWDYCDHHLGGVRDPNRHDAGTLGEFVGLYNSGGAARVGSSLGVVAAKGGAGKGGGAKGPGGWGGSAWSPPAWGDAWAAKGGSGCGPSLADFVKAGQRASVHWKNAWQTYCALYGRGFNDPSRHDDSHITGFIDYVGQIAFADLQNVAEEQGVPLERQEAAARGAKRPAAWPAAGEPPAKRAGGAAGGAANDQGKSALVDKVKALQRSDPTAKEAWWSYCENSYNGVKDPNRHDAASLEAFLSTYGVA